MDHRPPPTGYTRLAFASRSNNSFISASFLGSLLARSVACEKSERRLYSTQGSLSGDQVAMLGGKPGTHGTRGPQAAANQPSE